MNKPVPHDMIIRSFINSHGVAGDNRKPEELVDDYYYCSCCDIMYSN